MEEMLSTKDAYKAMFVFLERIYNITKSDELGILLGSMSLLDNNKPVDSAMWEDWLKAIEKVKLTNTNINLQLSDE